MKHKASELLKVNRRIASSSFGFYREMLLQVAIQSNDILDTNQLVEAIHRNDWKDVYKIADALGGQKYPSAVQHHTAHQIAALIKKYPFPKKILDLRPEEVAKTNFSKIERFCKRQNLRFFIMERRRNPHAAFFARMRAYIQFVIGDKPDYAKIWQSCDFGAGASLGVHGDSTHVGRKINERWTVTAGALPFSLVAMAHNFQLFHGVSQEREGIVSLDYAAFRKEALKRIDVRGENKVTFVPKTAKTHRVIAVEPTLNIFVQKGIDKYLRLLLRRNGTDLSDQSKNQRLAREGSENWSRVPNEPPLEKGGTNWATIDLSNASDTISIGLARMVLPCAWFDFLNETRSQNYTLDKKRGTYEKFVSAGNGFCFPLETLIFKACLSAAGCKQSSVYGDDLIVPAEDYDASLAALKVCGFQVNARKSFGQGPFRESCGADWYAGTDVRPFTLDFALDSIQAIFKFLNLTRRNLLTEIFFTGSRPIVFRLLPRKWRFVRPRFAVGYPDDSAITGTTIEELDSPFILRKGGRWYWLELLTTPVVDKKFLQRYGEESRCYGMYAALQGVRPDHLGRPQLTLRRKTQTKVVRKHGSEATSLWLPPSRLVMGREFHDACSSCSLL